MRRTDRPAAPRGFQRHDRPIGRDARRLNMLFAAATAADLPDLASKPEGFIAGWATSPALNSYGYKVAAGAFDQSIRERGLTGPTGVKLLVEHRSGVAGPILKLEPRGERLWIEAQLDLNISYAKDAYYAAKSVGGVNFSVGFDIKESHWDEDAELFTVLRGDLHEVSVVTFPANADAQMLIVHSSGTSPAPNIAKPAATMAEFEKRLVALGFAPSRNDARRLAQEAKRHAHLFGNPPATPVVPAVETPPVPAVDLTPLSTALADLKRTLGSSSR